MNDLRVATSIDHDEVAVTGNLGASNERGFFARVEEDGQILWQYEQPEYIPNVAIASDDRVYGTPGLYRIEDDGTRVDLSAPESGIFHLLATPNGTFIASSTDSNSVTEYASDGSLIRNHLLVHASSRWYEGGLCQSSDAVVALSGTIAEDDDFGILPAPLQVSQPSAFVLVLKEW